MAASWKHSEEDQRAQQQYSQTRDNPFDGFDFNYSGNYDTGEYSDFFEELFGSRFGSGQRSGPRGSFRGQDYETVLELSLQQAAETHQQTFTIAGRNIRITVPAGVTDGPENSSERSRWRRNKRRTQRRSVYHFHTTSRPPI